MPEGKRNPPAGAEYSTEPPVLVSADTRQKALSVKPDKVLNILICVIWICFGFRVCMDIPQLFYDISHLLFSTEFRVSTRRSPAAARRRTAGPHFAKHRKMGTPEVHRVRTATQEQHRNRKKEPLKTKRFMQNKPNLNIYK